MGLGAGLEGALLGGKTCGKKAVAKHIEEAQQGRRRS